MSFKTNRVNRNFVLTTNLYFNSSSWNRSGDTTPRFYLKPSNLTHLEKVAFNYSGAKANDYVKRGHKFWGYKKDDTLTNKEVLEHYDQIKTSYPYGFVQGDIASENKYNIDVKNNDAFQSFYKSYWDNNPDKIKQPKKDTKGEWDHPHPYISFTTNEIITAKHNVGAVPVLEAGIPTWAEYGVGTPYYSQPEAYSCMDQNLSAVAYDYYGDNKLAFIIEGGAHMPLVLANSGHSYTFNLQSGATPWATSNVWPTGVGGAHSGIDLHFSTGRDGTWNGFDKLDDGVAGDAFIRRAYEKPGTHTYYVSSAVKDGDPNTGHPWYNSGSVSGFVISGESQQSGPLNLYRGWTYVFNLTGSSNVSERGTDGNSQNAGGDYDRSALYFTNSLVSGEWGNESENELGGGIWATGIGAGIYTISLDWDCPDTFFYQNRYAAYYGGVVNVTDPPTALGDKPGQIVRITLSGGKDEYLFYYSPNQSGMGGLMILKGTCDGKVASI